MILGATVQKLWEFNLKFLGELWAGWACAGTNQQELTTCAKSGGQHKKNSKKKKASQPCPGIDPRPASDQWSLARRGLTPGQGWPAIFFLNFFIFLMLLPTLWSIFY
jgi:hypothetical protein